MLIQKLGQGVEEVLSGPELSEVREAKHALNWYRQTREGKVHPSWLIEELDKRILAELRGDMAHDAAERLEGIIGDTEIQSERKGLRISRPLLDYEISADFVVRLDEEEVAKMTVGLNLHVEFVAEGIRLVQTSGGRNLKIDRIDLDVSLSHTTKMMSREMTRQIAEKTFTLEQMELSAGPSEPR